jgi:hypothetical protein
MLGWRGEKVNARTLSKEQLHTHRELLSNSYRPADLG